MAERFNSVYVAKSVSMGKVYMKGNCELYILNEANGLTLILKNKVGNKVEKEIHINKHSECLRLSSSSYLLIADSEINLLTFDDHDEMDLFHDFVKRFTTTKEASVFSERTDEASATQYFQFYGNLSQQQNMLQDYIRTSTYQKAILKNSIDFTDKVVLDVGSGCGILSFFAVQAGAKLVYAVEASSMAQQSQLLISANNLQDKIKVIPGKLEEIELPEQVDVIISEPLGYMLFNERMIESFLHARKWLKPEGLMFPSRGDLHIVPFMDDALFMEIWNKAKFWDQPFFHGVNLSALKEVAEKEYFRQPVVDSFDMRFCLAKSIRYSVDFSLASERDLHRIEIPLDFNILETGTVHGLALWFEVAFIGSKETVWLSTSPTEPLTHWYQVRCLLRSPIAIKAGQILTGTLQLQANNKLSYDITMELAIEGVENSKSINTLDLKNSYFRYPYHSPSVNTASPSGAYWSQLDSQTLKRSSSGEPERVPLEELQFEDSGFAEPAGPASYPPGTATYPPGPASYPPGTATYPPGPASYPPGPASYPPGPAAYPAFLEDGPPLAKMPSVYPPCHGAKHRKPFASVLCPATSSTGSRRSQRARKISIRYSP